MKKHIELLGLKVEDKVTGYAGVVTSISFDLYGCIQAIVTPGLNKDGKRISGDWFDVNRLIVVDNIPVMEAPNFAAGPIADGGKGPAEKPVK